MTDGITPVYNMNGDEGFAGGGIIWIFLLFFLLAGGNGGWGGQGGQISNDFLYTNLNSTVEQGFGQVANQVYGLNTQMLNGFSDVGSRISECCCTTNRNIDSLRYDNALNTRDIIENATANTQAILDKMCATEVAALREKLNTYEMQLSNQAQSANIINALRPFPTPAYITCSPYTPVA